MKMSSMLIEVYEFSVFQEISAKSRLSSEKVSLIYESEFRQVTTKFGKLAEVIS